MKVQSMRKGFVLGVIWLIKQFINHLAYIFLQIFFILKNVKFFHQVGKGITFVTLHNMLASGLSPHIMLKHLITSVFHRLLPMLQGCFLSKRLNWKKDKKDQEKIGTIESKDAKHFQNQSPIMIYISTT